MIKFQIVLNQEPEKKPQLPQVYTPQHYYPIQTEIEKEIEACKNMGFLKGSRYKHKQNINTIDILGYTYHKVEMPKVLLTKRTDNLNQVSIVNMSADELLLNYDEISQ
jgi:hypothetical protein